MVTRKKESTALTVPEQAAIALNSGEYEKLIRAIIEESKSLIDVLNPDARAQVHSAAMARKALRIQVQSTGKSAREQATAFSKAVIAEEKRLVDIIQTEEQRLLALRDEWDKAEEAKKEAKRLAERNRVNAIQRKIEAIRCAPVNSISLDSKDIDEVIKRMQLVPSKEEYEEFQREAVIALAMSIEKLESMKEAAIIREVKEEELRLKQIELREQEEAQNEVDRKIAEDKASLKKREDEVAKKEMEIKPITVPDKRIIAEKLEKQANTALANEAARISDVTSKTPESWAPERIWLQRGAGEEGSHTWSSEPVGEGYEEVEYIKVESPDYFDLKF